MKRAFTLIELLVVIAIIAILAAILFPVFAAAKASAKAAADLSNVDQQATAIACYTNDFDDNFPLQAGWDPGTATGGWGYSYMKLAPYDWPDLSVGAAAVRSRISKDAEGNSILPYTRNWELQVAPGSSPLDGFHACQSYAVGIDPITGMLKRKFNTTYAYNGFLNAYSETMVVNPAICPMMTEQNGFAAGVGVTFANPALTCGDPSTGCLYKPYHAGCTGGVGDNGGTGYIYTAFGNGTTVPYASYWCNKRGGNWAMSDTHAKFRILGGAVAPNDTNADIDPMTQYDTSGHSNTYWWDGCHAWLYRPDYSL